MYMHTHTGVLDIRVDIHVSEDEKRNFLSRVHSELINDPFNDLRSISELMLDVSSVYHEILVYKRYYIIFYIYIFIFIYIYYIYYLYTCNNACMNTIF